MKQSPLQAIKKKCLDCVCFQKKEVKLCPADDCPLWVFRFGKNPFLKGKRGSKANILKQRAIFIYRKKHKK